MSSLAVQLLTVAKMPPNPQWRIAPHYHTFHELVVVFEGVLHVRTAQESIAARRGDVLFYQQGMVHEERSDTLHPVQAMFISFTWNDAVQGIPLCVHDAERRMTWLIQWLYDERYANTSISDPLRQSLTQLLIAAYLNLTDYREPDIVEKVRHYIRAHIAMSLNVQQLADIANLSRHTSSAAINASVASPPWWMCNAYGLKLRATCFSQRTYR